MKLTFKIKAQVILIFFSVSCAFSQGHDSQLNVYKNILNENGEYKVTQLRLSINPSSTVLVVIDFWDNVAPQRYIDNTINLIGLARGLDIPVIFFSHERPLNSQLELSDKDIVLDGSEVVLENYLFNNGLDVNTILFAGFHTAECLTITRLNSVSRVSWRSPGYSFIVVKDCTYTGYWQYLWAINSIETKFQTTTLASLTAALLPNSEMLYAALPFRSIDRDQTKYTSSRIEEYRKEYKKPVQASDDRSEGSNNFSQFEGLDNLLTYDSSFGLAKDWRKHALVVINPSTRLSDKVWEKRAKANINRNVSKMIQFARRKNIEVVYYAENNSIDPAIRVKDNERNFDHPDSMFAYLSTKDVNNLIYVGNITNASQHFIPLDAWRFTIFNGGFNVVFLEDCLITNELPVTIEQQIFKKLFLEAAVFYRAEYRVSTLSILYDNSTELSINESFLDQDRGTLKVELFNRGGLPHDLSKFALALKQSIPSRNLTISPKYLNPGHFHLTELSLHEFPPGQHEEVPLYLLDHYGQKVDSIMLSIQQASLGRFPDGGAHIVSYKKPSLGKSNYQIEQERFLCDGGGRVKLTVNGADGFTYAWNINDSISLANNAELTIEDEGVYSVTVGYGGHVVTSAIDVEKGVLPDASWEMDGYLNFCANKKPVLRANPVADYSYYWMHDDVIVGTQSEYQVQLSGYYSLQVKDKNGCTNQSAAVLLTQQESETPCMEQKVVVIPNPSNGRINMLINDDLEITTIELYDTNGRRVYECEDYSEKRFPNLSSAYEIELTSDLESGLYFLMVKGPGVYYVERIVINN